MLIAFKTKPKLKKTKFYLKLKIKKIDLRKPARKHSSRRHKRKPTNNASSHFASSMGNNNKHPRNPKQNPKLLHKFPNRQRIHKKLLT